MLVIKLWALPSQEAKVYAEENGLFFMETSAKTAANVNDIFHEIGNLQCFTFLWNYFMMIIV